MWWYIIAALIGAAVGALAGGCLGWFACEEYSKTVCRHLKWGMWQQMKQNYYNTPNPMFPDRKTEFTKYWQQRRCEECGLVETKPMDVVK